MGIGMAAFRAHVFQLAKQQYLHILDQPTQERSMPAQKALSRLGNLCLGRAEELKAVGAMEDAAELVSAAAQAFAAMDVAASTGEVQLGTGGSVPALVTTTGHKRHRAD